MSSFEMAKESKNKIFYNLVEEIYILHINELKIKDCCFNDPG
jgi:hypothetical protein